MSNRQLQQMVYLCLVVLLLVGCGGAQVEPSATSTPVPPTLTLTPVPPTLTPTPPGILLTPIPSGIAGGWTSEPGSALTISLYNSEGQLLALVKVEGTVEWDEQGRLAKGAENFLEIQTQANLDHWYKIVDHEVRDGLLSITAEDGIYTYFTEAHSATPTTRATAKATVTEDGNWQGQASFFITGFSWFSALIYQDIENYEIQR